MLNLAMRRNCYALRPTGYALMYGKDVRSIIRAVNRHRQAMAEKAQMGLFD